MNVNREIEKRPLLPAGWRWVKLDDMCEIIAGQSPPGDTYRKTPEGLPFFQGKADFGEKYPTARNWCIEPTKIAKPGDILISIRAPVGPTNIANQKCCIGRGLAALRCGNEIEMDFLLFWLKQVEDDLEKKGSGSTFGAINRKDLEEIIIPLPPLAEQKRIAAILNEKMEAVGKARAAAEAQLAAAKALPAAYFREVFPKEGAALPPGWRWVKLAEVCEFRHGGTPSKNNCDYWSGTIPWVSPKDMKTDMLKDTEDHVSQKAVDETSNYIVSHGTLFIVARSGILSRHFPVAVAMRDMAFNQDIKALLPKEEKIISSYLYFVLKKKEIEILSEGIKKGATVHSLKSNYIENLSIPLPPLSGQKRIAAILKEQMEGVDKARAAAENQLDRINALPGSLLRKAFSGGL